MDKRVIWGLVFLAVFLLGLDIWNWGRAEPLVWGLPYWVAYLFGLTLILSGIFALFVRDRWRD